MVLNVEYRRCLTGSQVGLQSHDWNFLCRITVSALPASLIRNTWGVRRKCHMPEGHLCRPILCRNRVVSSRLGVHWNQRLLHEYVACYVVGRLVEILLEEVLDIVVQEGVDGFLMSGDHCGRPDFVQMDKFCSN